MKNLGELKKGQSGKLLSVQGDSEELTLRLMEMGLLEGSDFEVMHEAPYSGDPIAVRVRGALIALRRAEASKILIQLN